METADFLAAKATPGSLWGLLAKLSWADPDVVRAHSLVFSADLQAGPIVLANSLSSDGDATPDNATVVAKRYFLCRRIVGYVESDPAVAAELDNALYVGLQIEDDERQFKVFRETIRMRSLAGNRNVQGIPIEYDEYPLVFAPGAKPEATFLPLSGLGITTNATTGKTTRRAEIVMHGCIVAEAIVDNLIAANAEALRASGLLQRASEKR